MYSNLARVNVYFETLNVLERVQVPSVSVWDMFASVGGTMGLWVGVSICTVIEFVFLLVNLCLIACKKCFPAVIRTNLTSKRRHSDVRTRTGQVPTSKRRRSHIGIFRVSAGSIRYNCETKNDK